MWRGCAWDGDEGVPPGCFPGHIPLASLRLLAPLSQSERGRTASSLLLNEAQGKGRSLYRIPAT